MRNVLFRLSLACLTLAAFSAVSQAADSVQLRSVVVNGPSIRVSYFKNFATCAHMLNASNAIIHIQNLFCDTNIEASRTLTSADFKPGMVPTPGQQLKLCHGNNYNICSPLVITRGPGITNIAPAVDFQDSMIILTLTPFTGTPSVTFNGVPSPTVFVVNASQIQVKVPVRAPVGAATIVVTSGGVTFPQNGLPFQILPRVVVRMISPSSGSAFVPVGIWGEGFRPDSKVRFGSLNSPLVTYFSPIYLRALAPLGVVTAPVQVYHSFGGFGGRATSAASFTAISTPPQISSFSPGQGAVGSSVSVAGVRFTGATSVKFNGVPATQFTVVSDTSINAAVPVGASSGPITVTSPGGSGISPSSFTVLIPPQISSFSPSQGPVGTVVTLTGLRFTGASSVKFNGVAASQFTVVSDTAINATVPSGASSGVLSVTTPGGSANSLTAFTVLLPPQISAFSPGQGVVGSSVAVSGLRFTGASSIKFNGVAASQFTVVSDTAINATVPSGASSGVLSVTTPGGSASSSSSFTVLFPPIISGFTPNQEAVGAVVVVSGSRFTGASSVTFNGLPATAFTVESDSSFRAIVPVGAATGPIRVVNSHGTGVSPTSFIVNPLCNPTIKIDQELAVRDLSVVNDPRTLFNPANLSGSHWSFGYLMGRMAGVPATDPLFARKSSDFIKAWLNRFKTATTAENGAPIVPRPAIDPVLLLPSAWPRLPGTDDLDLTRAPLRLLAIVNRLDLRNAGQAGEGRFVFGVVSGGFPQQFTVILEYQLPLTAALTQNAWALKWHELAPLTLNTTAYRAKLQEITDLFSSDSFAGKPNGSAINQVRTNEIALANPWELREFRLPAAGGNLTQVTVKQTPRFNLNTSTQLRDWILANQDAVRAGTHVIPPLFPAPSGAPFLDGASPMPPGFRWALTLGLPEDVRRSFSLNTCSGCHSGETNTAFLHVGNRSAGSTAFFSAFMVGDLTARATGPNGMRQLLMDLNCQ